MDGILSRVLLGVLLVSTVWGSPTILNKKTNTYKTVQCSTGFGSSRITPVPRTTYKSITHLHSTVTSTIIPTSTFLPSTSTFTSTVPTTVMVTITDSTVTDTATTASTSTELDIITSTSTSSVISTISTTVTVTTAATTVPEPAGFTPVAVQFPTNNGAGAGIAVGSVGKTHGRPLGAFANGVYPTLVVCTSMMSIVTTTFTTTTASATTVTASTPTTTVFTQSTTTSTSTITPGHATTTSTVNVATTSLSTSTVVTTVSSRTTTTTTSYSTIPTTLYAVCEDPQNYLTQYMGSQIDNSRTNTDVSFLDAGSAYDCCILCAQSTDCSSSIFIYNIGQTPFCALHFQDSSGCDPTRQVASFGYGSNDSRRANISNSGCGQYTDSPFLDR